MADDEIRQKLVEKLEALAGEVRDVYDTAERITRMTGVQINLPDIQALVSMERENGSLVSQPQEAFLIDPGTFFRMDKLNAVEKYLDGVRKPTQFIQICNALAKGGLELGDSDRDQLNISLTRSNRRFKKFGSGIDSSFGLLSWYEDRTEKKRPRFLRQAPIGPNSEKQSAKEESKNGSSETQLTEENK